MKKASVYWFTGMSGAGKTTLALEARKLLNNYNIPNLILDGDIIRNKRQKKLSFSREDIIKNNRLITKLCTDQMSQFEAILVPIISPYRESRKQARKAIGSNFNLIYIMASMDTLVARDTKGLYKAASEMTLNNLIGFSKESRYEAPKKPELVIDTGEELLDKSVMKLFEYIIKTVAK